MPDWKRRVRDNLRLRGFDAAREDEIVEELAQQLDEAYRDGLERGMPAAEAAAFAWDQCPDWHRLSNELQQSHPDRPGALGRLEERAGEAGSARRWWPAVAGVSQDILFALRMMRKAPGFTAAAVLTLALGIGANSTIFSVISATLLRPLPFPDPGRLVSVWQTHDGDRDDFNIVSAPNFWDWQRLNTVFESIAVFDSAGKGYNLGASGERHEAEQVSGVRVSAGFFRVLGVEPALGRAFLEAEEAAGRDRVVVISHGLWIRRYGGDPGIVGRQIRLDGENRTVVGVMPPGFRFQFLSDLRELWVPAGWTEGDRVRSSNSFMAIARLKAGIPVEQADAEIDGIQGQLARQHEEIRKSGAVVVPLESFGLQNVQRVALVLLAAVALVLLIGCVNVANLMLARGAERRREFAVRRALGASSGRILRQLLAESVLLSVLGGAAGLALSYWASSLLAGLLPRDFSRLPLRPLDGLGIDGPVLAFTLVVACLTGIVFGIAPALSAARGDAGQALKEGSRESSRGGRNVLRHALVASEVGLALVLLAAAGLMIKSMVSLVAVDPGFDPGNVLTMEMAVPQANTYYGPPDNPRFCQEIEDRVASLPGVLSASAVAHLPLRGNAGRGFHIEGRPTPPPGEGPSASYTVACPGYFRTLGVPVLSGREFTARDTLGSPEVVVINDALARRDWPGEDPIGKRLSITIDGPDRWLTIVGVVRGVRHWGLAEEVQPQLFRPYTQAAWPRMQLVARTAAAPLGFAGAVKRAMAAVEPDRPLSAPRTMEEIVRGSVGAGRFPMLMLAAFAALALVLAAVGIAGVVSFSVAQRTNEIGVRVALGAQGRDVVRLLVRASMAWVLLGVAAGAALSAVVSRLLSSTLYGVKPMEPLVLASVAAILAAVALAASYLPARRATRMDPLAALRTE